TGEGSYATFLVMVLICANDPPLWRVFHFWKLAAKCPVRWGLLARRARPGQSLQVLEFAPSPFS
ncbi:hypothetical protein, partial [Mesorhizobium sp. M7A.F.Ca.CA.004.08.1.1]|uniref:hypothetical protein n=1 Tax=Mesorhizobium sp. M7A.F.Ca.CA.004.08.1.1 TaxID=2496730 RepID=UPI0019D0CA84